MASGLRRSLPGTPSHDSPRRTSERSIPREFPMKKEGSAISQPGWLGPELATLTSDRFSDAAWIYERKFDGERCLAFRDGDQLRLMTRNQQQVTGTYPEIAAALRG